MAIAFGSAGAATPGTTSLSLPLPSSIAAGNLLVIFIASKYPTNTPSQPSGYTTPSGNQYSRGGGTPGTDTGDVYITTFIRIADGTESSNVAVTCTGVNTCMGIIMRYTKGAGNAWDYACAGGADNTAGTSWSVTAGSNPGVTANDMVLVGSALCGNTDTATSEAISQTGVTFGTMVERQDSGTNNGDDCSLWVTEHPVSSGTGSAAPVYTATVGGTGSANAAGASIFIRLREVPPVQLAGTATMTQTAAGALANREQLASTATMTQSAAAAMNLRVPLSSNATMSQDVAGSLSVTGASVQLAGEATMTQTAAGALAKRSELSSSATMTQSADGALANRVTLSGTATMTQSADGALANREQIASTATMTQSAAAAMNLRVPLSSNATMTQTVAGSLNVSNAVQLGGTATMTQSAAGELTIHKPLAGMANITQTAAGVLAETAHVYSANPQMLDYYSVAPVLLDYLTVQVELFDYYSVSVEAIPVSYRLAGCDFIIQAAFLDENGAAAAMTTLALLMRKPDNTTTTFTEFTTVSPGVYRKIYVPATAGDYAYQWTGVDGSGHTASHYPPGTFHVYASL